MATNYTLGRGRVYLGRYITGTQDPEGERYVGNTPALSLNITVDRLDHFSSDHGINEKDDDVIRQVTRAGTLTMDDIQPDNLALFFFGETSTVARSAGTALTDTFADVIPGRTYQLGVSAQALAGVRGVVYPGTGATLFKLTGPAETTYVQGTDYTVDPDLGRLTILDTGAISSGTDLTATYNTSATSAVRIISGSTPIVGSLRLISDNPKGTNNDVFLPKVSITPNGDFNFKGDDWETLTFSLEVLKKDESTEAIYVDGRPVFAG